MGADFSVKSITALQLHELLGGVSPPLILDVREKDELEICALPAFAHIPLGDLPAKWEQLPHNQIIVTVCHHGVRSLRAAAFLKSCGIGEVLNLAGGIQAWAEQVDPFMARY